MSGAHYVNIGTLAHRYSITSSASRIRNPSSEDSVIALVSMSFDGFTDGIEYREPLQRIPSSTEMSSDLRFCVNARIAPVYTLWTLERGGTHSMALTRWYWSARSVKAE